MLAEAPPVGRRETAGVREAEAPGHVADRHVRVPLEGLTSPVQAHPPQRGEG